MLAASYLDNRKLASLWHQIDETDADVAFSSYHLDGAMAARGASKAPRLPKLTPQHLAGLGAFTRRYFQALVRQLGESFAPSSSTVTRTCRRNRRCMRSGRSRSLRCLQAER